MTEDDLVNKYIKSRQSYSPNKEHMFWKEVPTLHGSTDLVEYNQRHNMFVGYEFKLHNFEQVLKQAIKNKSDYDYSVVVILSPQKMETYEKWQKKCWDNKIVLIVFEEENNCFVGHDLAGNRVHYLAEDNVEYRRKLWKNRKHGLPNTLFGMCLKRRLYEKI